MLVESFNPLCGATNAPYNTRVNLNICNIKSKTCCQNCKLNMPITFCPSCHNLTVMPDGVCLSCERQIKRDEVYNYLNTSLIYVVNACIYAHRIEKDRLRAGGRSFLDLQNAAMSGFFGEERNPLWRDCTPRKTATTVEVKKESEADAKSKYKGPLFLCR